MTSEPALKGRLGTAIMYSSVWEYTDTVSHSQPIKKDSAHQRHQIEFPFRSSLQRAQSNATDTGRKGRLKGWKGEERTKENGLSQWNTWAKCKCSRRPSIYILGSNCTVSPAGFQRDLLLDTWVRQEIMTVTFKWRSVNPLVVCIRISGKSGCSKLQHLSTVPC